MLYWMSSGKGANSIPFETGADKSE